MTDKSEAAFRTISEAADEIGLPAHVLRFWETRFAQLQPMKRAGGRRYYRPADMALLRQIKALLQDQGMTIRGAQMVIGNKASAPTVATAVATDPVAADWLTAPELAQRAALLAIRDRLATALAA